MPVGNKSPHQTAISRRIGSLRYSSKTLRSLYTPSRSSVRDVQSVYSAEVLLIEWPTGNPHFKRKIASKPTPLATKKTTELVTTGLKTTELSRGLWLDFGLPSLNHSCDRSSTISGGSSMSRSQCSGTPSVGTYVGRLMSRITRGLSRHRSGVRLQSIRLFGGIAGRSPCAPVPETERRKIERQGIVYFDGVLPRDGDPRSGRC